MWQGPDFDRVVKLPEMSHFGEESKLRLVPKKLANSYFTQANSF